jgi:hypothetical protein
MNSLTPLAEKSFLTMARSHYLPKVADKNFTTATISSL